MRFTEIEVNAGDGSGEKRKAKLAECDDEGCRLSRSHLGLPQFWIAFQVDGQDHFHLQCAGCGISYCPLAGDCALEGVQPS